MALDRDGPVRGLNAGSLRGRPLSLRSGVLGLVAGIVAAFLGFAALAVWQVQRAAEQEIAEQLRGTARAMALVVDREFSRAEALLQGLGRLPSLRAGDMPGFLANARVAAEGLGMPVIGVAGADGLQRTNTVASSERLAAGLPAAAEAMRVFQSGRIEISDYVDGNDPGEPRILLAVPVRTRPDGPVAWSIGVVIPRERLTRALTEQRIPADWVGAVIDRRGTIVARTRAEDAFVGKPATADVRAALAEREEGVIGRSTNLEGATTVAAFARAPVSGYSVIIGAPQAAFAARRQRVLLILLASGLPLALLAGGLALLLVRRVSGALAGVARPSPAAPRLLEVDALVDELAAERQLRDQVEAQLRERGEWLESAPQAALVGVWETDFERGVTRWSAGILRLLGRPPQDEAALPAGAWLAALHPEDAPRVQAAKEAAKQPGAAPLREEFRIIRADGTVRWVRGQGVTQHAPDGRPQRMLGAWIDITERRTLEEAREAAMRQHDLMAAEIHHRIRNSLQLVLSLLLLQARRAVPEAAEPLRDAATRVATIAKVHRRLYEAGPDLAGDVGAYLAGLAGDVHASVGDTARGRDLDLQLEAGVSLAPDRLPAIGIVVTELITNALKYGARQVTIGLRRDGGTVEVTVQDGGPGFPAEFDPAQSRGLGMRVAMTLARQLGGTLEVDRGAPGGRVVLRLPAEG